MSGYQSLESSHQTMTTLWALSPTIHPSTLLASPCHEYSTLELRSHLTFLISALVGDRRSCFSRNYSRSGALHMQSQQIWSSFSPTVCFVVEGTSLSEPSKILDLALQIFVVPAQISTFPTPISPQILSVQNSSPNMRDLSM